MTPGRSAEVESSKSRRQHCASLLQEVVEGEKVRREVGARGLGRRVASHTWAPSRSSAGPRGHRAAELLRRQRTLRAGRLSFLPATKTALGRGSGSGSGSGGQDPSTARVLSHPRSETRLRRTQGSRARRAAPHLGQCRAPPRAVPQRRTQARGLLAATTACPRPFPPRRMRAPQPQLPPGRP